MVSRRLPRRCTIALLAASAGLFGCDGFRADPLDGGDDAGDAGASPFSIVQQEPDAGALRAVWAASPQDVFAVGDDGHVVSWVGGKQKLVTLGVGFDATGVWGSSASDVLVVGTIRNTDLGFMFHFDGAQWVELTAAAPHGLKAVWGIGDQRFTSCNDGVVYLGTQASPLATGIQVDPNPSILPTTYAPIMYSIAGNSASSVMVAADVDTTVYYDGSLWHTYADPLDRTRTFRSVWGPLGASPEFYEGANYYGLWRFTGPGQAVVQLNEEKDAPEKASLFLWSMWGPQPAAGGDGGTAPSVVAVGDHGRIMTYVHNAVSIVPSPTLSNLYGVFGISPSDLWIVGAEGLILHGALDLP